jgi:hypothetical protein
MEKEINAYIGDIVSSLIKEAAFFKTKCDEYKKELEELKKNATPTQNTWTGVEDSVSSQKL